MVRVAEDKISLNAVLRKSMEKIDLGSSYSVRLDGSRLFKRSIRREFLFNQKQIDDIIELL